MTTTTTTLMDIQMSRRHENKPDGSLDRRIRCETKGYNYTRIKKCACQGKLTLSMWYIDQMKTLSKAGSTKIFTRTAVQA